MLDFNTLSSKRNKLLKSNNKLFSKSKFTTNEDGAISKCYWACINSTKGCKAKVNYSINQLIAREGHDGMSLGIIDIVETDHDGEYCTTNAIDIVVRNARNDIMLQAAEGGFCFTFYMFLHFTCF